MNKRIYLLLTICLICVSCKLFKRSDILQAEKSFIFPLDWIGHYEGELFIFNANNDTLNAKMELIIDYPNAEGYYPWTLIYNDEDIRSYGLEAVNPEIGHYRIDEYNSIILDAYYKVGHFISRFAVLNSDLVIDYSLIDEGMEVRFYITGAQEVRKTGGEKIGGEDVPEVSSYSVLAFQKAILKKKEKQN